MVVVVIIGVLAVAAAPSMRLTTFERHAYNDAGSIMQLFRGAHGRAVAYGVPVLVSMSASGTTADRGTFNTYVANNPIVANTLVSCKTPFQWAPVPGNANLVVIDSINLNGAAGTAESDADIETQLTYWSSSTATPFTTIAYMCFTPLGHSYVSIAPSTTPWFDSMLPNIYPLEAKVQRKGAGGGTISRSVLVLPNGSARVFSHIW
jgi:hypothetical protein